MSIMSSSELLLKTTSNLYENSLTLVDLLLIVIDISYT